MIIKTEKYIIQLHNDVKYIVICSSKELDHLIELIGENNIFMVEEGIK